LPFDVNAPTPEGLIDHVTPVWLMPDTVAVKCCVAPGFGVTDDGVIVTETVGGTSVMVVCAFVPSDAVAVAITVCRAAIRLGALYVMVVRPDPSGPDCGPMVAPATAGLKSKVTVAFVRPVTRAVSVQVPPPPSAQPLPPDVEAPSDTSVSA
jgi:hypothetical protein